MSGSWRGILALLAREAVDTSKAKLNNIITKGNRIKCRSL